MNADDLGRSRTDGANQIAGPSSANVTLWPSSVCSWPSRAGVSTSTIDADQVGRNVVAEVDNRRAARRQQLRAVGLVSPRRYRVIGRKRKPVLVNRQVGRRHHRLGTESGATVTVSVEDEVSPSWSVIV